MAQFGKVVHPLAHSNAASVARVQKTSESWRDEIMLKWSVIQRWQCMETWRSLDKRGQWVEWSGTGWTHRERVSALPLPSVWKHYHLWCSWWNSCKCANYVTQPIVYLLMKVIFCCFALCGKLFWTFCCTPSLYAQSVQYMLKAKIKESLAFDHFIAPEECVLTNK